MCASGPLHILASTATALVLATGFLAHVMAGQEQELSGDVNRYSAETPSDTVSRPVQPSMLGRCAPSSLSFAHGSLNRSISAGPRLGWVCGIRE